MITLAELRDTNNGVIESERAFNAGVTQADLSRLCRDGKLVRIGRGQFVVPMDRQDSMAAIAYDKKMIFSHQSALYLHGIVDSPGARFAVTCIDGPDKDTQLAAQCDAHYVPQDQYELGRTMLETPRGNLVPAYDLERSVCDVAAAKDEVGPDTFLTVMTQYAQDSRYDEQRLYEYGDALGVSDVLRGYLEVLVWARSND